MTAFYKEWKHSGAYVKTLCDLHGMSQFSIAFDVYLQLIANVDSLVDKVLHCNSPNWHLKHCCLACTYTLEGEQPLQFSIQYALDGNDSLKHIQCKLLSEDSEGWSTSIELPTCQVLTCNQHLSCKFVDQYTGQDSVSLVQNEDSEVNPCAGCWKNMDDQKTKKTWGVYKETGIMLAVCRHGFSVLIADMPFTHSSSTKHPLTIISKLLEVVGKDFGVGYDIACQFKTTPDQSPLLGLGLEDPETCECTFSRSNALTSTIWYASAFHQRQSISGYFKHNDHYKVYANLSKLLYDNYKQALDTICLMKEQDMSNKQVFEKWLVEEKAYLEQLSHEPPEEMLQMEYWEQLIKLTASMKPNIDICWKPEDAEWQCTERLVANREYQRALDCLEGLVVAWIFKSSKMNRGWHRHQLHWDEVIEYAFLLGFDLLRDLQQDISWKPWTVPTAHLMMDWYFKKCHALEEVQHLNIKIHHFVTYIQDEDWYLHTVAVRSTHQISIHHNLHGCFNTLHLKYLYDISQLPGFTGTFAPGISALKAIWDSATIPSPSILELQTTDTVDELEQQEDIEENVVQDIYAQLLKHESPVMIQLL
ncbi:hypothetical protein EV401DRAFT_2062145 [Pisolithus croceorrhizus]|nr:hypothetical protein EV401DRAFT_2062145 [Pisolithus croceorrhizus]